MAYKAGIPPAVMRELDTKREDLVSAAPEAKTQAGRQERTFTAHQLCVWSWAGGNQSRCDASPGDVYSSVEGEGDLSGSAEGVGGHRTGLKEVITHGMNQVHRK